MSIFNILARSPLGLLRQHMERAQHAVTLLAPFMTACMADEWSEAKDLLGGIASAELSADKLKRDLLLHLHKGLFLAIPRADLLSLVMTQDEVANKAEDIAGLMYGRRMKVPAVLAEEMQVYLARSIAASEQAKQAVNELDDLFSTSFSGQEISLMESMVAELETIETETDRLQIEMRQKVATLEDTVPAVEIMFLYELVKEIGALADCAQQIGYRLLLLLAR